MENGSIYKFKVFFAVDIYLKNPLFSDFLSKTFLAFTPCVQFLWYAFFFLEVRSRSILQYPFFCLNWGFSLLFFFLLIFKNIFYFLKGFYCEEWRSTYLQTDLFLIALYGRSPLKFSPSSRWGCVAGCQDQLMLEFFFPLFFVLMREKILK